MIEPIGNLNRVLISKPGNPLLSQFLQGLLIKPISNNNSDVRTDLSLQIDDPRKAKCKNHLQHQHVLIVLVTFAAMILRQVAHVKMDENVQKLSA